MDELLSKYRQLICDSEHKEELFDELFREYKMRVFDYFDGTHLNENWSRYVAALISIERYIPLEYIINTSTSKNVNEKLKNSVMFKRDKVASTFEIEDILDYLVYYGRQKSTVSSDINDYDYVDVCGKCQCGSEEVDYMAGLCGLKHRLVRIDPGFSFPHSLLNGFGFHYFNLIEYKGKEYLVDVTYKQFFRKYRCSFERLGVPKCFPPLAGAFMIQDSIKKSVAETILKRGWIELTPETRKAYFDGFALSYRNGLYYEDKDIVFETDYTSDDYNNFLSGRDNQVKHEGEDVLGYQLRPLKDPSRIFK